MKILLIDNGTSYLEQLKSLLLGHDVFVIQYSQIDSSLIGKFDVIILSGGHTFTLEGNEEKFQKEIELIRNSKLPIFGICFGFEIIAHSFGAKLEEMRNKEKGILDIEAIVPEEIFLGISKFQVFENHRFVVRELPEELLPLAKSKDGIEAFKHKTFPIYAVQFHPEMFTEKSCGDEIFKNFLGFIERSKDFYK